MSTRNYATELEALIAAGAIPPFVYCYPTRSSYRAMTSEIDIRQVWKDDLNNSLTRELNLYIHVPFCRYKCGFCNLYTTISTDQELYDRYIGAVCSELDHYCEVIQSRDLRTIYIGGGTPSLLSLQNFDSLIAKITKIYPNWRSITDEVALEASPDSIVSRPELMQHLVDLGFTRVNLGIQSLKKNELKEAGRTKAYSDVIKEAIHIVRSSGIANLSTDLIMGFEGQTDESWMESVVELAQLRPETISTYFLTVRPDAWFSGTGRYRYARDPALYKRYDGARDYFLKSGYVQESNVRYKIPGRGGYRQKVLQFRGVPYLGVGVGARTYTNTVDYLSSGGTTPHIDQIYKYIEERNSNLVELKTGFIYDDEERIRKRLVLDLFDLDLEQLEPYNIREYRDIYSDLLDACVKLELLNKVGQSRYQLTKHGYKFRDIISWMLFSDRVRSLDSEFYASLHNSNPKALTRIGKTTEVSGLLGPDA